MNDQEIRRWLRRFGYHCLLAIRGKQVATAADYELDHMVRFAQKFHGLVCDGIVGPKTIAMMQRPRCGCPDHRWHSRRVPAFGEACRLEIGVYADWSGIQGITPAHATEVMVTNFRQADRFNLRMQMVDDPRDALINIRMGYAEPGVLAWMEVGDGCGWQHQSLFNIDVDWSDELIFAGTNMHEVVGHGAGVGHSASIGSIMDPRYDPEVLNVIDPWFAEQLEKRYGLSAVTPDHSPPTSDPSPSPQPTGVFGMDWQAIWAILLPILIDCIENGANDGQISTSIRSPNSLQRAVLFRGVKKYVRRTNPGMRRRERRATAHVIMDSVVARGLDAHRDEIKEIIKDAHSKMVDA